MAQEVELLLCKCKVLNSNPRTTKTNNNNNKNKDLSGEGGSSIPYTRTLSKLEPHKDVAWAMMHGHLGREGKAERGWKETVNSG
jgi:hypothetical protein